MHARHAIAARGCVPPPRCGAHVWRRSRRDLPTGKADCAVCSAALVLAAAAGSEGPGPLISTFIKNAGEFPIPIVIVPGNLSDADNCAVLNWRNKKRPLTAWCGIVDSIHRRCYSSALSPPSLSRAFQARPPTRPRIARCLSRWLHRSHIVRKRIYSPDADRTHPHRTCDRPTRAYDRRW